MKAWEIMCFPWTVMTRLLENLILHRSYHFFYFDIPENIREFTIVIPQITYASKDNESIVEYGPWEIHVTR